MLLTAMLPLFSPLMPHAGASESGRGISVSAPAQRQKTVTGAVSDERGEPLAGATVIVRGTSVGVTTAVDGTFTVSAPAGSVLDISYIGYATVSVDVTEANADGKFTVRMTESVIVTDDVVVVGYGIQKKATLSGSVATLGGKEIARSPAMNVTNSLAGTLPGLVVAGQGGEPGNDASLLYIRGQNSLNNNTPLIVVDGVPNRSLERIDPNTIESVNVLKDASAAIYGSQAANGVILVTTKRGNSEKMKIEAGYRAGWSQPTRMPGLTNAAEYATLVNEVSYYMNPDGGRYQTYTEDAIRQYAAGNDPWRYPDTDWFDAVMKTWSPQHNANISMSGGNRNVQAYVALSSRYQDGYFKESASNYAQHDLRANIDGKINDYVTVSADASIRMEDAGLLRVGSGTMFNSLMTAAPVFQAWWPDGSPGPPIDDRQSSNPVVHGTKKSGYDNRENYIFNVTGKIDVRIPWLEGLSLTATGAIDRGIYQTKKFDDQYRLYTWDGSSVDGTGIPVLREGLYGGSPLLTQTSAVSRRYLTNLLLNYRRTLGRHSMGILAGMESIEEDSNSFSAERRNFPGSFPDELDFGDPNSQYASGRTPGKNRWLNYFGRANYSFMDRYIAEFVWRYQGSSKFSPESRWGFFPGISAAYRLSEEDFWTDALKNIVNDAKLRVSWGKTGNDLIDPYQFLSQYEVYWQTFVSGDGKNNPAIRENLTGNPLAQWEEARQWNAGVDLSFFNRRLNLTADWFSNLRTKILIPQTSSTPTFTGIADILPDINLGRVRNRGFDFSLNWRDRAGDFSFAVTLNGGYARNKVLFFDEAAGALPWQMNTGYPMHSGLYYRSVGIFHTQEEVERYPHMANARPGDVIFEDVDGDGEITGNDKVRIHKSSVPQWTGGLNLYFSYGGFDLSALVNAQAGAVRYVLARGSASAQYNYWKTFYDNRWTEENPGADYPRTFDRNNEYWVSSENQNTFWLKKTDFIRLKNLELGYTLPRTLTAKAGLESLRLSIGGMNLLTFSPDMKDFDPELNFSNFSGEGYPLQKIITAGISVNF
jgi:TonB-linked SusC/RagA family outer membrane protein